MLPLKKQTPIQRLKSSEQLSDLNDIRETSFTKAVAAKLGLFNTINYRTPSPASCATPSPLTLVSHDSPK